MTQLCLLAGCLTGASVHLSLYSSDIYKTKEMVIGLDKNLCISCLQALHNTRQYSPIHTLVADVTVQGATCSSGAMTIHTHLHIDGGATKREMAFSILPEDTSTCRLQGL